MRNCFCYFLFKPWNMRNLILLSCSLILLLSSCTKQEGKLCDLEERGMQTVVCNPSLVNPRCILAISDKIVIYQDNTDYPFVVYPLPLTGEGFYEGTRGRGPGEVLRPDVRSFVGTTNGFSFVDLGGVKKSYEWDDTGGFRCVSTQDINIGAEPLNGVKELSTGYLNMSMDPSFEYRLTNKDGVGDYICSYPDFETDPNDMMPMRFNKTLTVHPDKDKFAAFYGFDPYLRIVSSEGKILKEVLLPLEGVERKPYARPFCFSGNACSDEKHILAKFADRDILLFNWNGKLLRRFQLDTDVSWFTYDFEKDTLYAIDITPEEGPRLVYCDHFLN